MEPEITKTEENAGGLKSRVIWLILGLLALGAYFVGLNLPFIGPDEPRYAQVGREMLERGDWITPTLDGVNWFEKPPLLYWLEMASYKLFGVSEFSARLGPVLCGFGTVASLWILGTVISPAPKTNGPSSTFAGQLALIAASTLSIIAFSHGASCDIVITFCVTAALVSFFSWHWTNEIYPRAESPGFFPLILFYTFIGLGLLAKGLIGFLPFVIVAVFYLFSRRLPNRVFFFSLFWGSLLTIAIASVWYLPMYQRHGYQFVDEFILQQHLQRFTTNKYRHPQPFYFYFWVLPLMTLPWLPFFIASIWKYLKDNFHHRETKTPFSSSPLLLFAFAWLLVPLILFSISGSKLPGYVLPAVPATVILTATFTFHRARDNSNWQKALAITAASTFSVAILFLTFVVSRFAGSPWFN